MIATAPFSRRVRLSCVLLIAGALSGCALGSSSSSTSPRALAVPSAITETRVRAHMEFLASDALNGRGSGTRDEWIAVSYAAALMQQWGLEPVGDSGFVHEIPVTPDGKRITITKTWNAIGRLPGRDPVAAREVILLSAHIDHLGVRPPRDGSASADTIYNGADDDASGSVAVLELARALAMGPRPKRTIVFALFGTEELGGFGSRAFADRPVVPLSEIVANLQFEMIGRPDPKVAPDALWLTGFERSNLGPVLAAHGARLVQDPHPEQKFFVRSDNIQFARRGVVAHTVSSFGLHKEYHQPSDELRLIDFPHMTESIQSMLAPIQWLGNSGFKPEWLPGQKP